MIIDVYGLLATRDFDTEIKVGRLNAVSVEEAHKLIKMLDVMAHKVPESKQFICEYRWEKVED